MDKTIICNQVLMHMMDVEHNECRFSNGFVELNPTTLEYYDKKLEKIFNHPNLKEIEVGNFASITLRTKQMFEDDQKESTLLTKEEYKKRSAWKRFVGWFAHLLTPFL